MSADSYTCQLGPVEHATAQGPQKEILDMAQKKLGFIPNMYARMVNAPAVLGTYLHGYDLFRGESGFSPAEQEVVCRLCGDLSVAWTRPVARWACGDSIFSTRQVC